MTVTAVPLQPVKRSYLVYLWIGIVVLVAAAFLLARQGDFYHTTASGLKYHVIATGTGDKPTDNDIALVMYEGRLLSGETFDRSQQPMPMPVAAADPKKGRDGVVPGFSEALKMMNKGAKYRFVIPARLAYGAEEKRDPTGKVVIPANSPLVFDVEMLGSMPADQFRMLMQQQQMMGGGAPGGPGATGGDTAPPGGENLVPPGK